jgi:NAD(P)-dependent dehydrogenase (short-subunit alcohol dehydrogenase family)
VVVAVDLNPRPPRPPADEVGGEAVVCDVADEDQVRDLFDGAAAARPGRHRLQQRGNLAAGRRFDPGHRHRGWNRVMTVNATSVYYCCKYVIPHMRRQGKGSIINTASFVALLGAATSQIAYTASKGAVLALTRELGVQFAREGIRVNALCPGPIATPLLMELFAKDPGARRPPARGTCRWAASATRPRSPRRRVPRQRRRELHDRQHVRRRRGGITRGLRGPPE